MKAKLLVSAVVALTCVTMASATVLIDDDFESYAPSGAGIFDAANWGNDGAVPGGIWVPGNVPPNPDNATAALRFTGTISAKHGMPATVGTDAAPLVIKSDIYDGMYDDTLNTRSGLGLRTTGGGAPQTGFIEFGMYQNSTQYQTRLAYVGTFAWEVIPGSARQVGWHTFTMTIDSSNVTFEIDMDRDGTPEVTHARSLNGYTPAWNEVRLGSPSDVSSNYATVFDNVVAETVPEPATLVLLGISGLFLRRRRA